MYEMKGSQIQITPKEFVDKFYKYDFDVYGLKYEKIFSGIAVSLCFYGTHFYTVSDGTIYEAIGLYSGARRNSSDCNMIIYIGDIQSIHQRYRVFKEEENNTLHKNYDYIFTLNNGKALKFESHQKIDA